MLLLFGGCVNSKFYYRDMEFGKFEGLFCRGSVSL